MPVPVQCLPLDSGPALPKPGRAHVMGSDSHMLDTACVEGNGNSPLNDSPRVRSDVLDATDVQSFDDMGTLSVRASAISDGCRSSLPSRHHHVDHFEPRPISTRKSSSSIANKWVGCQQPPTLPNNQSRARNDLDQARSNQKTSGRYESPSLRTTQPPTWDEEPTQTVKPRPETRPISQDQLVAEVKGIYAGLVMVETKCIEVDNVQSPNTETNTTSKLNNDQWQALIALHRTLLHEHHDFFLASEHPSAGPALRRLAFKYAMPARMWRHGIHSFLELLRHQLPGHILTFPYLAYVMIALLLEMVPAFEDTWIECLGDLGRYRMAIEDDDARDRETWTEVSHHWYNKASGGSPTTNHLYHHLAILARPNALQQLSYYTKSHCVRESIMTLYGPVRREFGELRWLFFFTKREPGHPSYLHLVVVVLLHLTRTHTNVPRAVMFELLHLIHECLTLYRFDPYTIESLSRYPHPPQHPPEDWISDVWEPTLAERQLKLWPEHRKFEPTSERHMHDICPIHHTHNWNDFSPGGFDPTTETFILPAYFVHLDETDCVAAKIVALFRIVWWTSVSSFHLLFRTFKRVSSSYCSGGLPALSLL